MLLLVVLLPGSLLPQTHTSPQLPGITPQPVALPNGPTGTIYLLGDSSRSLGETTLEGGSAGAFVDVRAIDAESSPGRSPRLSPAPHGNYLAIIAQPDNAPGDRISILDLSGVTSPDFLAALGDVPQLGRFGGWHPDGRHLLYIDDYGLSGLWSVDVTGAESPVRLWDRPPDAAAFSPDGEWLAYSLQPFGRSSSELWLARMGGAEPVRVLEHPGSLPIWTISWAPDGAGLLYTLGWSQIWSVRVGGQDARKLSSRYAGEWPISPPAWSPDGSSVAFTAVESEPSKSDEGAFEPDAAYRYLTAHVINLTSGADTAVHSPAGAPLVHPVWAPDGSALALVGSKDSGQLWMAGRAGESPRMVAQAPGLEAGPVWYSSSVVTNTWNAPRALPSAAPEGSVRSDSSTAVAPFLATPYYGAVSVNSIFDHNLPNYSRNGVVVRYDGVSSSGTGWIGNLTMWYDGHDGVDFGNRYAPILASADGTVTVARWASTSHTSSYGLYVEIDHGNGFRTRYGHMSALAVSQGQQVKQGQVIGTSGTTGNSTGPHLHFSVHQLIGGTYRAVDPFGWKGGYADPWTSATSVYLWLDNLVPWTNSSWPAHPIAAPGTGTPIVIDEPNAGFEKGCKAGTTCPHWYASAGGLSGSSMLWTYVNGTAADYWARWRSTAAAGAYQVHVWVPADNTSSWQTNYVIAHSGGTQNTAVDQLGTSNLWLQLGTYCFGGDRFSVTVNDATGEGDLTRRVGVDALRFVPVPGLSCGATLPTATPTRTPTASPTATRVPTPTAGPSYIPSIQRQNPSPTPVLGRPVLATIVPPGPNDRYTVSWSAVPGATGYTLQSAGTPGFTDAVELYSGPALSHGVKSHGMIRYFRVRAVRGTPGAWSDPKQVEVLWETEPNDLDSDPASGPLLRNRAHYGRFPDAGDGQDTFFFDLPAPGALDLWLLNIAPDNDYDLYLLTESGDEVAKSVLWDQLDEHIEVDALAAGRYLVRVVRAFGPGASTVYELETGW